MRRLPDIQNGGTIVYHRLKYYSYMTTREDRTRWGRLRQHGAANPPSDPVLPPIFNRLFTAIGKKSAGGLRTEPVSTSC